MIAPKTLQGFLVNPIGIGTWELGGGKYSDSTSYADYDHDAEAIEAIRYSIKNGQNHIDTAEMYGDGHTEEIVRKAIKGIPRQKLFIASKIWKSHLRRSAVLYATEGILERLGIGSLDLLYLHAFWPMEPLEATIQGLNDAVDRGLTKAIAVSNFALPELKRAVAFSKHPIVANQMHYNVMYQREVPHEMIDFVRAHDMMLVAYRPIKELELGILLGSKLLHLAKKYGKTQRQIALNWIISQDHMVSLVRSTNKDHIDENLGALDFEMSEEDLESLRG